MTKVLITGSLGQLGRHVLLATPKDVAITAVDLEQLDIARKELVIDFVRKLKPDLIINAAAYTDVDKAETESDVAFAVNSDGPYNLALAVNEVSARLIHVSTDYVFGGTKSSPYTPEEPPSPLGVYGQSKIQGESRIASLIPKRSVIVRTAWLYSAHGNNFLKTMLRLMSSRDSIGVVADQISSPTSARTLAQALWRFAEKQDLCGVYHFTDNGVASWYDFAVAIQEEALSESLLPSEIEILPISTEDYPTPARRPACSVLDTSKTFADLAIKGVHWRKALRQVLLDIARNR